MGCKGLGGCFFFVFLIEYRQARRGCKTKFLVLFKVFFLFLALLF